MANVVEVVLSTKDAQTVRAWMNYRNNVAAVEAQLNKLGPANTRAAAGSKELDSQLLSIGNRLTGMATAGGVAGLAIKVLRAEFDALIERAEAALSASNKYSGSLETLAFNTAGDKKYDTLDKVEAKVREISKQSGVGVNEVARAVSNAASAKGQLDLDAAFDAVQTVMEFAPNSPQLQDVLSGASLDIRKMYPNATAKDAVGFTAMLGQQARITDPSKVAENALPAALLMSKVDQGSLKNNAAIYAAITQATGDVQGRTSRTGGIALALQLEKALPELKDTMERVQFMQDNPELANQFLNGGGKFKGKGLTLDLKGPDGEDISFGTDKASFEKKVIPAIRELFTKGSATDVNMRSALEAIPEIEDGDQVYQKQLESLKKSKTLAVTNRDRSLKTAEENKRIDDVAAAQDAATQHGAKGNLEAAGVPLTEVYRILQSARARSVLPGGQDYSTEVEKSIEGSIGQLDRDIKRLPDSQNERRIKTRKILQQTLEDLRSGKLTANQLGVPEPNEAEQIPIQNYGAPATPGPNASAAEKKRFQDYLDSQKPPAPVVNVQVNMPGGAAPAKPVPAANIGRKPQ